MCNISLKNNSQTEIYTIFFETEIGGPEKSFVTPFPIPIRPILKGVQQPTPANPFLIFNSFYFQPYNTSCLPEIIVSMAMGGGEHIFTNDSIKFINSTYFKIEIKNTVGIINYSLKYLNKSVANGTTSFKNPIIQKISMEQSSQITIQGELFGQPEFRNKLFIRTVEKLKISVSLANMTSNSYSFQLTIEPVINYITPISLNYSGGNITLTGLYLNCKNTYGSNSGVTIKVGGMIDCINPFNPEGNENNIIVCTLRKGNDTLGKLGVNVTINGISNDDNFTLVYGIPSINSYTQNGDEIKLVGYQLDGIQYISYNKINFTITSSTSTQVNFKINSTTTNGNLTVFKDQIRISPNFYLKLKPTILSSTPVLSSGGEITINGIFLHHQSNSNITVLVGNNRCLNGKISQSNDNITCLLSNGTGSNQIIQVIIDNQNVFSISPDNKNNSSEEIVVFGDNLKIITLN